MSEQGDGRAAGGGPVRWGPRRLDPAERDRGAGPPAAPVTPATAPTPPLADDAAARERIRGELGESLLVEAAAGTGKTTVLVERLVAVLARGATTVDRVAALTFTHKAAGELKLRLRQELDAARAAAGDPTERARLAAAIAHLEEARIGTIHAFCAALLRERPVEAGIDPGFEALDEDGAAALYRRAFRAWIERRLDALGPGLRRALCRLGTRRDAEGRSPLDALRLAGWTLAEHRDFPAPWRREPFARTSEIDDLAGRAQALAHLRRLCPEPRDLLFRDLAAVDDLALWIERSEAVAPRDYDGLEARLVALAGDQRRNRRKGAGAFGPGVAREAVVSAREALLAALEGFERRSDADLAALLQAELGEVTQAYEDAKRAAGALDFLDLLLRARDLVRDDAAVRRDFQQRYTHLFVDELQDTDPLQFELLLLLAADDGAITDWRAVRPVAGKLFLVGDPKQSIYRFRRADVLLYQEVKEQLERAGVGVLNLTRNFRAVAPLQRAVNAAFAPLMTGDRTTGQPAYVPLAEHRPEPPGQPSLVALPVPRPYGTRYVSRTAIEASLPDAVGAWLQWLLAESGWTVGDPDDPARRVPVAPRHVGVLFRRFVAWRSDVTRDYARALEVRGVPHVLVGARTYHHREEVETLRLALAAVEWPDDELAVFGTLKGALFAVTDEDLLRFRAEVGRLHPFLPLPPELPAGLEPVGEALAFLADLHRQRNRLPIAATADRLLRFSRAHAALAIRPAGHQALANVERLVDLARRFEMGGGGSFRAFVERLEEEAQETASSWGPAGGEEGAEGVRLMTLHAAKGLEFPVVLLADITAALARGEPDRHVDAARGLCAVPLLGCVPWDLADRGDLERQRDAAEGVRVAYVAATRARDLLVVPAVGDEPLDRWVAPLNRALYPSRGSWRAARRAPGCPSFGDRTVLWRPDEDARLAERSVAPGLHQPEEGGHEVVWWDPALLRLGLAGDFGLRQQELLAEQPADAAAEGLRRYQTWRAERDAAVAAGSVPSLRVSRPADAATPPAELLARVTVEEVVGRDASRPSGARFGTLVHTLLRDAVLGGADRSAPSAPAVPAALARPAQLYARLLGATPEEEAAAVVAVAGALAHPRLRAARAARRQHAEVPFAVTAPHDGRALVEGVIDLVYLAPTASTAPTPSTAPAVDAAASWVVVDFKTDAELGAALAAYERQVAWYLYAVERLLAGGEPGAPALGVILRV